MTTTFEIRRIEDATLDSVRTTGLDVSGNPVEPMVAIGSEPLRCCLRDAKPGEELILFGYEPPLPASPYREIGAVFAHADRCAGPDFADGYPPEWVGRRQILRAYDRRGWIHPSSQYHNGSDPEAAIAAVLAYPDVVQVHSRNSIYGCYMFTVVRPGQ